jgi:hypothetical protein
MTIAIWTSFYPHAPRSASTRVQKVGLAMSFAVGSSEVEIIVFECNERVEGILGVTSASASISLERVIRLCAPPAAY